VTLRQRLRFSMESRMTAKMFIHPSGYLMRGACTPSVTCDSWQTDYGQQINAAELFHFVKPYGVGERRRSTVGNLPRTCLRKHQTGKLGDRVAIHAGESVAGLGPFR